LLRKIDVVPVVFARLIGIDLKNSVRLLAIALDDDVDGSRRCRARA